MWQRVFASGWPMLTVPSDDTAAAVDQIVVSVGP